MTQLFLCFPSKCPFIQHDINLLLNTHPISQPPCRVGPKKSEIMKKEVDYLLNNGLAGPSNSPWASPSLLVGKEDGSARFFTDYQRIKSVTCPDAYPIPKIDDLIVSVGNAKLIIKIDLLKGYYQIPLSLKAR